MEKRFFHPYYVLNVLLPVAYAVLRVQRLHPHELGLQDMFGVSRELQIYVCLLLMLVVRYLSSPTLDVYFASAFMFIRVSVLVCLWYMDSQMLMIFVSLWTLISVVCPQPRFKHLDSVVTLNNGSFNERITKNPYKTIYVVWFHATWSPRCTQLAPVFSTLAEKYAHARIRFAKLDVSRWPAPPVALGISMAATTKQLPTVVCFKQGKEVSRIPIANDRGEIPRQYSRGFTADEIATALDLDTHFETACEWESDAQKRLASKKTT